MDSVVGSVVVALFLCLCLLLSVRAEIEGCRFCCWFCCCGLVPMPVLSSRLYMKGCGLHFLMKMSRYLPY